MDERESSSFRDPDGFIFRREGELLRQINSGYAETYQALRESRLLEELITDQLLIAHRETSLEQALTSDAHAVIAPAKLPLVSYPYEWCFSQLKQAALLTLEIQERAIAKGFSLKDCSAFNVQFIGKAPLFIDTLSFERYREGAPWVCYRQYCEHFLLPLALMSYRGLGINRFTSNHVEGIPLELGRKLLPVRTMASFGLLSHIHLHGFFQSKGVGAKETSSSQTKLSRHRFIALVDHLKEVTKALSLRKPKSFWESYYHSELNYSEKAFQQKSELVFRLVASKNPNVVWDFGANTGYFSRLVAPVAKYVVSTDLDPYCVERNVQMLQGEGAGNVLPLVLDLSNPTPSVGWANRERRSFFERGPADLILALALIHHLAISNNVPLEMVAEHFARCGNQLVIEFVPKEDSQVKRLLSTRRDVFPHYNRSGFEEAFSKYFSIVERHELPETSRVLYLMERK